LNDEAARVITLLGSGAASWPLAVRAQLQSGCSWSDFSWGAPITQKRGRVTAFLQALQELGWTEGRTVQVDLRWGGRSPERIAA
jgi:hypothetical protein